LSLTLAIDHQIANGCSLGSFAVRDTTPKKDADYLKFNSPTSIDQHYGRVSFRCAIGAERQNEDRLIILTRIKTFERDCEGNCLAEN
jgi:hypothetical protein